MRHERERRQIALASIAANTKITVGLLEGLEKDDVSRWPSGIFRRSFVRAYAQSIGLDPDPIVREFLECHPDPESAPIEPITPAVSAPAVPVVSAFGRAVSRLQPLRALRASARRAVAFGGGGKRAAINRNRWSPAAIARNLWSPINARSLVIKVSIIPDASAFARGTFIPDLRRRWAAIGFDAALLLIVALVLSLVFGNFWTPFSIATLCYYVCSILILGNTPGVCLFAPGQNGPHQLSGSPQQACSSASRAAQIPLP